MSDDKQPPKYEFARLELKAGDMLALKVNRPGLTAGKADHYRKKLLERVPEGVEVVVIGPTLDLIVVSPADFVAPGKKGKK